MPGQPVPPGYAGFPPPVAPPKKNTGKIVLAVVGGLVGLCCIGAVATLGHDDATKNTAAAATAATTTAATKQPTTEPAAGVATKAATETTTKAAVQATTKAAKKLTVSQENAVEKAADYLDYTAFSRSGLIKQLKYEGFSTKDATVGVDAQKADWKEQAAKKAKEYLDYSSFSRSGLIKQLEYEGFTAAQASYGVSKVGL
ncbi:Ltp family lipoprotein [Actinoplanes sp. NPDC051411]|uniref:Ltp family lipoprotein n=1 Tax=Actinoplanes sp. NPDC051411 TaxID=3155522 RepID=UPI00341B00DB